VGGSGIVEEVRTDKSIWVRWAKGNKNVYQESDLLKVGYVQDINIGDIVERGPGWKYGEQDGGQGKRGIVTKFSNFGFEVFCKWEDGNQANYRWGSVYDLKVVKSIR
jgi:hypothetical protein